MTAIKAGAPIGEAKKLLAVKRVTFPIRGRRPPGVDGVLWKGARAKWRAACGLRRRGYIKNGLRSPGKPFASMAGSCTSRHQKRESPPSF